MAKLNFTTFAKKPLAHNKKFQFARKHALVIYNRNAIYSFIPKNACSTLRYSLGLDNGLLSGPEDIAWIHHNNNTFSADLRDLATSDYSFVVLRCPYRRLVSVFLNKIVDNSPGFIKKVLNQLPDDLPEEDLTFRKFVSGITKNTKSINSDIHWRPQSDFLIFGEYTRYFSVENFSTDMEILKSDIGFEVQDARSLTNHGVTGLEKIRSGSFHDTAVSDLRIMKHQDRSVPDYGLFFDEDLRSSIQHAYAQDFEIFMSKISKRHLLFR